MNQPWWKHPGVKYDLVLRKTPSGKTVASIRGVLAFDEDFHQELKEMGVKEQIHFDESGNLVEAEE